jgi:6-phosphogluconate dehydrogenase
MQLISEAYFLLKHLKKMDNEAIATVFEHWNEGRLHSYLMEISAQVLRHRDKNGDYLIDKILDTAGQKGTGKWSVINAMELGMPLGLIASAVFERSLSSDKNLRVEAAERLANDRKIDTTTDLSLVDDIEQALYASKLVSYAQGFAVLQKASDNFSWNLDLASIARMWRAGCIIRSAFLNDISDAYQASEKPKHLLFAPKFAAETAQALKGWKGLVITALQAELPVPALSSALNYYLSLTTANLPANMIQALRDFFGAHTFERIDMPRGEFFHEDWTGKGGNTHSGSYNV